MRYPPQIEGGRLFYGVSNTFLIAWFGEIPVSLHRCLREKRATQGCDPPMAQQPATQV